MNLTETWRRVRLSIRWRLRPPKTKHRELLRHAAKREFELLEGVVHPGIARPQRFLEREIGPALVFTHDPGTAVQLDHFLARQGERGLASTCDCTSYVRLPILLRHARPASVPPGLCPLRSILVLVQTAPIRRPDPELADRQPRRAYFAKGHAQLPSAKGKDKSGTSGTNQTTHFGDLVDDASSACLAPGVVDRSEQPGRGAGCVFPGGGLHILSNQPPAANFLDLHERLQRLLLRWMPYRRHFDASGASDRDSTAADLRPAAEFDR